ncbi:MAG: BT4734/BF3469 family protein, partial [Flavobacterium sp.]
LEAYSNFIILDIDKLSQTDLQNAKHKANQSEYTYASFISPSGNGLKILVKVNTTKEDHKVTFLAIQKHYETLLNHEIDKSGKDITRLCFYSFDDNLYHNEAAKVFVTSSEVEMLSSRAESRGEMRLSATNTNHSSQAEPVEASTTLNLKLDTSFLESELAKQTSNSEAIYNHCIRFTEKKVQYATGSRNVFVHQLACNLNRKGISLNEALSFILTDFGYDEKEVTQTVHSAYGNIHEFGKEEYAKFVNSSGVESSKIGQLNKSNSKKSDNQNLSPRAESRGDFYDEDDEDKPKPTQIDRLELFLSTRYVFRHNMVSGKLEFQYFGKKKWHVMNDFIENSMLRECLKGRIKTNLSSLRNLLYSDFCELYNPFEDYFYNLPSYDEKTDYILELANTITTTKQDLWRECFKKWIVAMVGCVLDEKVINHTVIVFSGKQGLGKTTWVEKLVPRKLKEYLFSGTINPNNKDTLVQLSECMLINLDELENLNR